MSAAGGTERRHLVCQRSHPEANVRLSPGSGPAPTVLGMAIPVDPWADVVTLLFAAMGLLVTAVQILRDVRHQSHA